MSDYDCYCDYERPSVFNQSAPVARKEHQCSECGRIIEPGTKYSNAWGIWDGRAETFKRCPACIRVADYIKAHVPCFCDLYGGLQEQASETLFWTPEIGFGGTRRYVEAFRWRELAAWKSKRLATHPGEDRHE